jgi:putative membrane-bound dehydrogenase-like protein
MSDRYRTFGSFFILAASVVLFTGCRGSAPPYAPEKALKTFQLPEGFRIELVAAEPEVIDPIAMAFDERGRLFVVELRDYPISQVPLSRIKMLEDLDGDGRFERSSVFVDSLHFAHGVMPWKKGILVTCAPDILYFEDTDGDGHADVRKVILTGFAQVNPQLRVNAPTYGMDNWVYAAYPKFGKGVRLKQFSDLGTPVHFSDHPEVPPVDIFAKGMDLRFKPDQLKLEAVSGNSEFGLAFDARGHRFPSWNDKHVQHVVIENRYLSSNPDLAVESAVQLASDHGDAAAVYPITENPHLKEIRDPSDMYELGHFTSACGQSIYTAVSFPEKYQGAYFVCEPVSNMVHCDLLLPHGATFIARRALEKSEFLASKDSWFMPVFTTVGPDGALYVVDFYRKIVEHPEWIRKDLMNDQKLFYAGNDRGRIYRVVYEGAKPATVPWLHQASAAELVRHLSNPNRWWRITAQRLLVDRQDSMSIPLVQDLAHHSVLPEGRMHALWTLEGLNALDVDLMLRVLEDKSPAVREQAIRLSERYLSDSRILKKLQIMNDPDDRVEFQLACTLGELPPTQSFDALRQIAARHMEDPWFQVAVLTSASENADRWLGAMLREPDFTRQASAGKEMFLRRIASIIGGARQKEREFNEVLAIASKARGQETAWWQAASIQGLAEGLKQRSETRVKLSASGQSLLLKLVEARSSLVGAAALEVAGRVELVDSAPLRVAIRKASGVAANPNSKMESRLNAVRVLGLDPTSASLPFLEKVFSPQQPEEVQVTAARALLNLSDSRVTDVMLKNWRTYTSSVRDVVLAGFFKEPIRLVALLDAIEAGKVQAWSLSRLTQQQLTRFKDEKIRKRAESLFAGLSSDRGPVIEKYRPVLRMSGNIERGKEIYKKNCRKCHRVGDMGFDVGPNLMSITARSRGELLENILDPNANIVPGYEDYMIQTNDGRTITGVMANQSATTVTLRRGAGEEDTILRSNIADLRALTVSAMPEDLEQGLSLEQMADLLEYLKTLVGTKTTQLTAHGHF